MNELIVMALSLAGAAAVPAAMKDAAETEGTVFEKGSCLLLLAVLAAVFMGNAWLSLISL